VLCISTHIFNNIILFNIYIYYIYYIFIVTVIVHDSRGRGRCFYGR